MIEENNGKKFGLPLSHCGLARGVLVYVEKFAVKMLKLNDNDVVGLHSYSNNNKNINNNRE